MKLTIQQIDQLYVFTRQHYVEWYDLQSELVDHLANAIEQVWEQNPNSTFGEILNTEFQKFGVFGFMDVVEERQKYLRNKYLRIVRSNLKAFFTLSKIIFTVTFTLSVFVFFKEFDISSDFVVSLYVLLLGFAFVRILITKFKRKQETHSLKKKWMFEEILNQFGGLGTAIVIPLNFALHLLNHKQGFLSDTFFIALMSIILVVTSLFIYLMFVVIPSKSKEYLAQTYPEFYLENL
jgi:hypothetical protein